MKIAVCFSGHARSHFIAQPSWQEYVFSKYETDVFLHIWDFDGYKSYEVNDSEDQAGTLRRNPIDANQIISLWNPKVMVIEKQKDYQQKFLQMAQPWYEKRDRNGLRTIDRPAANISMFYKRWACNELRKKHGPYDVVIVSRLDMGIFHELPSQIFTDQSYTYFTLSGYSSCNSPRSLSDYFIVGTCEQIDHWTSIYTELQTIYDRHSGADFERVLNPHELFYDHMIYNNKPFMELPIGVDIV